MTEKEQLEQEVDNLIEDFHNLDLYKRYLALKKAVEEDKHLKDLKKNEEDIKKSLKFLKNKEKQDAIQKAKAYLEEYNSSELVINYNAVKNEILLLVKPLDSIL